MTWQEPDGFCEDCGIDLDLDPEGDHDESHRQCWSCWRGDRGEPIAGPTPTTTREPRPTPGLGLQPESFVVAVAGLRRELDQVRERLDRLERRNVA